MTHDTSPHALGTETIRWDLSQLYTGVEDMQIEADVEAQVREMAAFEQAYKGKLDQKLGDALAAMDPLNRRGAKLGIYFFLTLARNSADKAADKVSSRVEERLAQATARHLTFFDLEMGRLSDAAVEAQMSHPQVVTHLAYIRQNQKVQKHNLGEEAEAVLTMQGPFGSSAWASLMDELEGELRVEFEGKAYNLPEILHVVSEDRDPARRAAAMKMLNAQLKASKHDFYVARTLNVHVGSHLANDKARGFEHPMQKANLFNMVDDATVRVLHEAVEDKAGKLAQRFYRLKARLLKLDTLAWSDRNAPMPFAADTVYDWDKSCKVVKQAYRAFSPTLGELVDTVLDSAKGWVDAPPVPNKSGGAFDYTVALPDGNRSYMMLNHLGSAGDVMTLAHELGHAVHGLLALQAQSSLTWHAPLPYAETASVFGEMLTFESLMAQLEDPTEKLALYMDKINDFMNTVVRQICFSQFEQAFFAERAHGKLTEDDYARLWMDMTRRFYGPEGETFTYADMENMWCYVSHFYSYASFYVYAYAFGELFTQSMMAQRARLGERFEPLYLDLLRAGGTKSAVELMAPFGLNPNSREFWEAGIASSAGVWLAEAEKLVEELGL